MPGNGICRPYYSRKPSPPNDLSDRYILRGDIPSHLTLPAGTEPNAGVEVVRKLLREKKVIVDYQI